MWIRSPENSRERLGIVSALFGVILITYSGIRIGRRVELWSGNLQKRIEAVYGEINFDSSSEEIKESQDYLRNTLYIGLSGAVLLGFGAVVGGTGESRSAIGKPTDYKSHSDWRRESSLRGTPDNPFRL